MVEEKGVQCWGPSVPDVNFVPENEYKLRNPSAPEGYVSFSIPTSIRTRMKWRRSWTK